MRESERNSRLHVSNWKHEQFFVEPPIWSCRCSQLLATSICHWSHAVTILSPHPSTYVCVYIHIDILYYICLSVCLSACPCPSLSIPTNSAVLISLCLFACLCCVLKRLSVCLPASACLCVYLSICLAACLFPCLWPCLSLCIQTGRV